MSRSPSPASSLDFFESDASSEEEYRPQGTRRAPARRTPAASTSAGAANGRTGGTKIRINLTSLREARDLAAQHPAEGGFEEEEYGDEDLLGSRVVDLSEQGLVKDHAIRPLWVDEDGNMWVSREFQVPMLKML